jgi:hypothetical protein
VLTPHIVHSTLPPPPQTTPQAVIKPQYVDHIPKAVRGNVGEVLAEKDQRDVKAKLLKDLDLEQVGGDEWVGGGAGHSKKQTNLGQGLDRLLGPLLPRCALGR